MYIRRCCKCCRSYREAGNDIDWNKLQEIKKDNNVILLDVRSMQEYAEGHIPGSICIPSFDISKMAKKILPDKQAIIVAYCEYGGRSRKAVNILKQIGYKYVYNLII